MGLLDRNDQVRGRPAVFQQVHVPHRQAQILLEVLEQGRFTADRADATRFARRHLAQERLDDRLIPVRDAGDIDHIGHGRGAHVAGVFAERSLVLQFVRADDSLNDNLRGGRHLQIDCLAAHDPDRLASQPSGHRQFIHVGLNPAHGDQADHRVGPHDDRHRRRFPRPVVFLDVVPAALKIIDEQPEFARPLDLDTIRAHVSDAGIRIPGHDAAGRDVRRGILAHGPGGNRKTGDVRLVSLVYVLLDRSLGNQHRGDRVEFGFAPLLLHLAKVAFQRQTVDRAGGPVDPEHHRGVEALYVLEQQRGPLRLRYRLEGDTRYRGDFPVLVHLPGDPVKLSGSLELAQEFPQVGVRHENLMARGDGQRVRSTE